MSTPPDGPGAEEPRLSESDWERRKRLAAVFGDVLPETTQDERDPGEARSSGDEATDAWLRAQVPPHHG
ncbi:MAG TPA: hypothetical protein VFV66_33410 [Nonomuraea sp.]|jgi:hypothetical protein|nr:hypothetical protein [Nonomuraea sp.]